METVEQNTDTVADAQQTSEPQQEAFYKSQQEVDQAFSKRMAAEREKWESERSGQEGIAGDTQPDAGDAALSYSEERSFIRSVQQGEAEIRQIDPNFDLSAELEHNPLFALMVAQGQDIKDVYEFFHKESSEGRLRKSVEKEIFERIRMRNNRPDALRSANAGKVSRDISGMSEKEIMDIDKRIKRGERVVL